MSLICSTLTWYLGHDPCNSSSVQKVQKSDDDFLSLFGGQPDVKSKKPALNKKRVYSSLSAKDIREV